MCLHGVCYIHIYLYVIYNMCTYWLELVWSWMWVDFKYEDLRIWNNEKCKRAGTNKCDREIRYKYNVGVCVCVCVFLNYADTRYLCVWMRGNRRKRFDEKHQICGSNIDLCLCYGKIFPSRRVFFPHLTCFYFSIKIVVVLISRSFYLIYIINNDVVC